MLVLNEYNPIQLTPDDIIATKKIRDNFPAITQEISEFYLQPYDGSPKVNLYDGKLERFSHGSLHVNRTAALIRPLWQFYRWLGDEHALNLSEELITLLEIVVLLHDVARKSDTKDIWEKDSQLRCEQFLIKKGISSQTAARLAYLIRQKQNGGILGEIFQSADAFDIARCKESVLLQKVSLYYTTKGRPSAEKALLQLVQEIRQLIADEKDLGHDCEIKIDEKNPAVISALKKTRDLAIKTQYEQAENCFQKIRADFAKFPLLHALQKGDFKSHSLLQNVPEIDTPLKNISCVKMIRSDKFCFILDTLHDLIRSKDISFDIARRLADKRHYVVTGEGIFITDEKPPMYTKEQKANFSSINSWSLVSDTGTAPIFNFSNSKNKLAGLIIDPQDVLFHYLFIYDAATVARPNYFDNKEKATAYYEQAVLGKEPKLFPRRQIKKFIDQVVDSPKYNEVLLRARFSKLSKLSKRLRIGIFSDDFNAKILALYYQKVAHRVLHFYSKETQIDLKDFTLPIQYYLPNHVKNWQFYSETEQAQDRETAKLICQDQKHREEQFAANNFEFLLFVEDTAQMLRQTFYKGIPILLFILRQGFLHIAQELLLQADKNYHLDELVPYLGKKKNGYYNEPAMPYLALQKDHSLWAWFKAQGADINSVNDEGNTPLLAVSIAGKADEAKYLLCQKVDVNYQDKKGKAALHHFISWKNKSMVLALLDAGAKIDLQDKKGVTALDDATRSGYLDMVKFFIDKGADINIQDKLGWTALHKAARVGDFDVVHYLVEKGVNIHKTEKEGWAALHFAAAKSHYTITKYLLDKGAKINQTTKKGYTMLRLAIENNHLEIVKLLIEKGSGINKADNGFTPLHYAAERGHSTIVKFLITKGADINAKTGDFTCSNRFTALSLAISQNHLETVRILFESFGENIFINNIIDSSNDFNALDYAIGLSKFEVAMYLLSLDIKFKKSRYAINLLNWAIEKQNLNHIEILINSKQIDVNAEYVCGTPLVLALLVNKPEIATYLLKQGADINKHHCSLGGTRAGIGNTALHIMISKRNFEGIKYLIENGADINSIQENNKTSLDLALKKNPMISPDYAITKYLFEHDAQTQYPMNYSVLTELAAQAIEKNDFEFALILFKRGVNFDQCLNGIFPFFLWTIEKGETNLTNFLLETKKIKINETNSEDWSILHSAADKGYLKSTQFLVKEGANIDLLNKKGASPLYLATKNDHIELAKYLVLQNAAFKKEGYTALKLLSLAVRKGNMDFLKLLLEKDIGHRLKELEEKDKESLLLTQAILTNEFKVASVLLENGFKISTTLQKEILYRAVVSEKNYSDEHFNQIIAQLNYREKGLIKIISPSFRLMKLFSKFLYESSPDKLKFKTNFFITNNNSELDSYSENVGNKKLCH